MILAALWAATTGLLFATGRPATGYVSGTVLSLAALTLATTHYCRVSWIFRRLGRPWPKG